MWEEQPPRRKVPLCKTVGRRLGVEMRLAQRRGEGNKGRSAGGKV